MPVRRALCLTVSSGPNSDTSDRPCRAAQVTTRNTLPAKIGTNDSLSRLRHTSRIFNTEAGDRTVKNEPCPTLEGSFHFVNAFFQRARREFGLLFVHHQGGSNANGIFAGA